MPTSSRNRNTTSRNNTLQNYRWNIAVARTHFPSIQHVKCYTQQQGSLVVFGRLNKGQIQSIVLTISYKKKNSRKLRLKRRGPHLVEASNTPLSGIAIAYISLAVMVYLKLSGSRLSRRPLASSTWGYIRKPSSGPLELGNLTS